MQFIDTHCHLTAFAESDFLLLRQQALQVGVVKCVIVGATWQDISLLAQRAAAFEDYYCFGLHPLYINQLPENWLTLANQFITTHCLVAIGEIGLDFYAADISAATKNQQLEVFCQQLQLAKQHNLPVILHSRKALDVVIKCLKDNRQDSGIVHAFNGSLPQAYQLIDLGFKLGFGGAMTYERAKHLNELALKLPLESIVIETDSPDMPPQWLYVTQQQRQQGKPQLANTPAQLPKIAAYLAALRNIELSILAEQLWLNSCRVLNINL